MRTSTGFISAALLAFLSVSSIAQDRTLDEFKEYVQEKTGGALPAAELNRFAGLVDKNDDGTISSDEFSKRMQAFGRLNTPARKPAIDPAPAGAEPAAAAKQHPIRFQAPGDATILLITADELSTAWSPFADWKSAQGKSTKIITVDEIKQQYTADSIQEQIRLCVRSHIENQNTRWVVLGGDCLPGGMGLVPGGHSTVHSMESKGIPTDIVYLSPTNWDADGDGIYGEYRDDKTAISYPDGSIGLGRVPVRTAEDVAAFTAKVIAYESRYPENSFAKQMVYTCTERGAYPKVRNSWDSYVGRVWDGQQQRFFASETPWDVAGKPGSHALNAENMVDLFNGKSVGKFHIHGHGILPMWVLEKSTFTKQHVGQLSHRDAYPLITTVSCFTGHYDSAEDPSIVESMIRQPNGGSVAVVAPVRTGKAHFANRSDFTLMMTEGKPDGTTKTMTRYWQHGLSGAATTGEAFMLSKADMVEDAGNYEGYHLCICELNLLGDPTLDMRAQTPREPVLEVASSLTVGKQTLHINTDAPGATVCVWQQDGVYEISNTDKNGAVDVEIITNAPGALRVTLSGPNLNSVSREVQISDK